LKVAAIPPPAQRATRPRSRLSGIRIHWPRFEARAEPICTTGPSRPTEPPASVHRAEATASTPATWFRIRPPFSATAVITFGHPVAAGLASEAVDRRAVEQSATTGVTTKNPRPSQGKWVLGTRPCWPNWTWPVASQVKK
jgi:anti-sigma factor RsiW